MSPSLARLLLVLIAWLALAGCASIATQRLAGNLSNAMLNQDDPETVRAGAPAYLLLLDGLIEDAPRDPWLLMAGARLYSAYAGALVDDNQREQRLTAKSKNYAHRALCAVENALCIAWNEPFDRFSDAVDGVSDRQIEALYTLATSWAGWIGARGGDWNALADVPKVERLLLQVAEWTPGYDNGRVQLYLGVIRSQLPPALGGKPETGRDHFELAINYSDGRDLMAKVEFARRYARLTFDQPLHDRLLNEVLAADPAVPGLTLSNTLAQQQAKLLLNDDYF